MDKALNSKFLYFIGLMLVVNLLWMNHSVSLWDEDESAYAGFGIEMLRTGDWVNPEYQWCRIHRKTPFHFWSIAVSYQIFGVNEFAVRMPSVLAILLTCLLVYRLGRYLFGEKNAIYATIILATSVQMPLMGKIAFTDASLLFAQTLAVLSLFNFLYNPSWKWNLGLWGGIALGVLIKGPPIILLTGGIWLLLATFHPLRRNLIKTHPWFFGLIALAPFAYWCYLSYAQDYALWQKSGSGLAFSEWWQGEKEGMKIYLLPFLWDWYVMRRIGGSVLGQSGFWGYHFVVLTVAFFTWLPFWFITIKGMIKQIRKPSDKELLLIIWIVMGWFFWEFMSSKLPSYSMGAQPALAFLMAMTIHKISTAKENDLFQQIGFYLYLFIFSVLIIVLPIAGYHFFGQWALYLLIPMSLVLSILTIRVWKSREDIEMLFQNIAVQAVFFMFLVWACVAPVLEYSAVKSFDDIVETAYELSNKNPEARLIISELDIKQQKISLLVYAKRYFGKYEEMRMEGGFNAYQGASPVVLIVGTEGIEKYKSKFEANNLPFAPIKVVHRSLDDALREHDFWVISNGR